MGYTNSAILVLAGLSLLAACGRDGAPVEIEWMRSIPLGIEAVEDARPLFVYFRADWCQVCVRMERDSFTHPDLADALARFMPVKIDVDAQKATAEAHLVHATPAYLIIDRRGRVLARELGYKEPGQLAAYLHRAADTLESGVADPGEAE